MRFFLVSVFLLSVASAVKFKQGRTGTTIQLCDVDYRFHERIDITQHRRTKVYRAEKVETREIVAIKVVPSIERANVDILLAIFSLTLAFQHFKTDKLNFIELRRKYCIYLCQNPCSDHES